MAGEHEHHWTPAGGETRSAAGTAIVAIVTYEVVVGTFNAWVGADLAPSIMPRIQAATPRSIARFATPAWTRYAGWIAAGAAYTVAAKAARTALPARLRR